MPRPSRDKCNPFVTYDFQIPVKQHKSTDLFNVDAPIEGNLTSVAVSSVKAVDIGRCVKLFHSEGIRQLFKDLSPAGKNLMFYVLMHLRYKQDFITIPEEDYCEEYGLKSRTFRTAKGELMGKVLAKRQRKDTYWINPAVLYSGSRVDAYPHNLVRISKSAEQNVVSEPVAEYTLTPNPERELLKESLYK